MLPFFVFVLMPSPSTSPVPIPKYTSEKPTADLVKPFGPTFQFNLRDLQMNSCERIRSLGYSVLQSTSVSEDEFLVPKQQQLAATVNSRIGLQQSFESEFAAARKSQNALDSLFDAEQIRQTCWFTRRFMTTFPTSLFESEFGIGFE